MKKKYLYSLLSVLTILIIGISCTKEGPYTEYRPKGQFEGTIYDFLQTQPDQFKYILYVFNKAGLTDILKEDRTRTVFLPTDQNLLTAMNSYNVHRGMEGLPSRGIDDIDSSSWRYILMPYIINGALTLDSFDVQDGLDLTTIAMRRMHGDLIVNTASGVKESGSKTIKFSYLNGSRYTKDWLSTYVSIPEVETQNGVIYVLENRHVLGFNFFSDKVAEPQNLFSEQRVFADGQMENPSGAIVLWSFFNKKLTAAGANVVETIGANRGDIGMRLTIHPNDSITVVSAPWSKNETIKNNGPCYFDPDNLYFVLNYSFTDDKGEHRIHEIIRYIAIRTT